MSNLSIYILIFAVYVVLLIISDRLRLLHCKLDILIDLKHLKVLTGDDFDKTLKELIEEKFNKEENENE